LLVVTYYFCLISPSSGYDPRPSIGRAPPPLARRRGRSYLWVLAPLSGPQRCANLSPAFRIQIFKPA